VDAVLCTSEVESEVCAVLEPDEVTDVPGTESARVEIFVARAGQVGFTGALGGTAMGLFEYRAKVYEAVSDISMTRLTSLATALITNL